MATIDLSNYNLSELKGLQFDIEREIKERQQREVKEAREQILSIAQNLGVSVEQLLGGTVSKPRKGKGAKVAAQYQNPADRTMTWSGRGRQPKWVVEALAGGKKLEELKL
jgi:DNA-binding protein H-NS